MSDDRTELFDRLYRDHQAMVYKLALGLTGNGDDAEEITQEAFSRAFRSYHTFRAECAFSTWIYRIAINVANNYLKQRAKFPVQTLTEDLGFSLEEVIDENPANNPETEFLSYQARAKCLHAMTECLPAEQRKVFCLAITLGLPQKLVAEILDCSIGAVKTTLHRAKQRWFGYMEDRCQLIKKTNPCSCRQWVRFSLSQGWVSKDAVDRTHSPVVKEAREDISQLRSLRDLYQDLYREEADASFAQRVREGIKKGEWTIFS